MLHMEQRRLDSSKPAKADPKSAYKGHTCQTIVSKLNPVLSGVLHASQANADLLECAKKM